MDSANIAALIDGDLLTPLSVAEYLEVEPLALLDEAVVMSRVHLHLEDRIVPLLTPAQALDLRANHRPDLHGMGDLSAAS